MKALDKELEALVKNYEKGAKYLSIEDFLTDELTARTPSLDIRGKVFNENEGSKPRPNSW